MRIAPLAAASAVAAVALLATGCGGPAAPAAPSPSSGKAEHPGQAGHGDHRGVRGRVTAENGSTWTVTTAENRSVTVMLTPQTAFGTKKAPATAAQFPVGSEVRVAGRKQGDPVPAAVTATRISAPAHPAPGSSMPGPAGPTA